jgi:hypothetical protein
MAFLLKSEAVVVDGMTHDGGPEFAEVYSLVWIGAMVVAVNARMLGGKLSFFQSVCVFGYCLLPLTVALVFCRFILLFPSTRFFFWTRVVSTTAGFYFSVAGALNFMSGCTPSNKRGLALYPVILLYFVFAWMIASTSG